MENSLEVLFKPNKFGNNVLLINGCKYMVNRRSGETVYWRCIYTWCNSRAVIKAGQLKSARGMHVCPQPLNNNKFESKSSPEISNSESSMLSPNCYQSEDKKPNTSINQQSTSIMANKGFEETNVNNNLEDSSSTDCSVSGTSSFLELVEDSSIHLQAEACNIDCSDVDSNWKQRFLASLKVYSEPEKMRRFKIAYETRKAWLENKKHFTDCISVSQTKWAKSNAVWVFSQDRPTRSTCMKLIKPERGTGVIVDQPLVPIKIIDVVIPSVKSSMSEDMSDCTPVNGRELTVESNEDCNDIIIEKENLVNKSTNLKEKAYKPFRNDGKCPICNKVFQSSLERHLNVHYGIKPYTCEYCQRTFSQEHTYRSHVRVHTSDRLFSCTICPKKFTTRNSLKRHIASHSNGKTFSCNICGKRFRKDKFLEFHNFRFHGDQQEKDDSESIETSQDEEVVEISRSGHLAELGQGPKPMKRRRTVLTRRSNKEDEDQNNKLLLINEMDMIERELKKRKEARFTLDPLDENLRGDLSRRLFTLQELKYADFLQPKVVLSKSLSLFITKIATEKQFSTAHSTAITNLSFHNYAKPYEF